MSHAWQATRVVTFALLLSLLAAWPASPSMAAETAEADTVSASVAVEEFTLDNGMKFLVVAKPEMTTVAGGWVAHVGSSNERPGITGISHLFEHMMFKGTNTIGTTNLERDLQIIAEQEQLQEEVRLIYRELRRKARLGQIEDPFAAENRPERLIELSAQFDALIEEQRELMVKNEFDKIYTEAGATGMNAFTNQDMTGYFITVPANKLELWFWMESDRLANPVMREFYAERDVVYEERRLRTESTPTGKFDEQFEAMFWDAHPYNWPIVGWPSDLRVISKEQADDYFATYYAPNNLTAMLVGNFDVSEVKRYAQRYFGRLPESETIAPDVVTLEIDQVAEKRMTAECDCQPQVQVRYRTVPFQHEDSYALEVLSNILTGRTGRLYKSLVLDKEIASSAFAGQNSMKYAGSFSFSGDTKGDATPEQLEAAWYEELKRLQDELVPENELQKIKNQITANSVRQLQQPFFLLIQLIFYDGMGDWTNLNTSTAKTLAVTAEDVKQVANAYFDKTNRSVATYYRTAGTTAEEFPPELADLPPQMQEMAKQQIRQLRTIEDVDQLGQVLVQIGQQKEQVPPQMKPMIEAMENVVKDRIAELEGSEGGE